MASLHFKDSEVCCPCCHAAPQPELFDLLEEVRGFYGFPMRVNSGMRCKKYNESIPRSSPRSQHILGRAADIHIPKRNIKGILKPNLKMKGLLLSAANRAESVKFIGIYDTFLHLDCREWDLDYKMIRCF